MKTVAELAAENNKGTIRTLQVINLLGLEKHRIKGKTKPLVAVSDDDAQRVKEYFDSSKYVPREVKKAKHKFTPGALEFLMGTSAEFWR